MRYVLLTWIESDHFIISGDCSIKGYNTINLYQFLVYFALEGIIFSQQDIEERQCTLNLQFKAEFDIVKLITLCKKIEEYLPTKLPCDKNVIHITQPDVWPRVDIIKNLFLIACSY